MSEVCEAINDVLKDEIESKKSTIFVAETHMRVLHKHLKRLSHFLKTSIYVVPI